MKINYNSKQSFSGYKNVLALTALSNNNESVAYMTMQLTNEGKEDLKNFQNLKSLANLPKEAINNDVLSLFYKNSGNDSGCFILDKNRIASGEILLGLENNLTRETYKPIESWTTKAYTFLADLTKRMANNSNGEHHDGEITKVMKTGFDVLKGILVDEKSAMDILNFTVRENLPFQKTAGFINQAISNTMKVFFKH